MSKTLSFFSFLCFFGGNLEFVMTSAGQEMFPSRFTTCSGTYCFHHSLFSDIFLCFLISGLLECNLSRDKKGSLWYELYIRN